MEFPHKAPDGFSYEFEENFKRNITRIWLRHHYKYLYNHGEPVRTVWGFYNVKNKKYFAPVNSKQVGKEVNIVDTRDYTAMPINRNPLMSAFYD